MDSELEIDQCSLFQDSSIALYMLLDLIAFKTRRLPL